MLRRMDGAGIPESAVQRFCDDIVVHVSPRSRPAIRVSGSLPGWASGLRLHPEKSRVVFCQQDGRSGSYEHTSFTFLGYTFRKRSAAGGTEGFNSFLPAVSEDAMTKMSHAIHNWHCTGGTRCH